MLEKGNASHFVLVEEDNHDHEFASRSGANHESAEEALLIAKVEESEAVGLGVRANFVADLVGNVVLEPALVDIQYLIEHARNVKAYAIELLWAMLFLHILHSEPLAIAESIFEFVAIEISFFGAKDWSDFR